MNESKFFISIVKNLAMQQGITVYQIAKKSGISPNLIKNYFDFKNEPSLGNFLKIAKAVNVTFYFESNADLDFKKALDFATEEHKFVLQKSKEKAKHWVVTYVPANIVIAFEEGKFNETQQVTTLEDFNPENYKEIARYLREIGDWLAKNHKNII